MTTTPAAPAAAPSTPPKTTGGYLVLAQDVPGGRWTNVGTFQTKSAGAAIRKYAETSASPEKDSLTLVAIPARSFRPVKVTATTETKLLIADVKP